MKTFILAGNKWEAQQYAERENIKGEYLHSEYQLLGLRDVEIFRIGTYWKNPEWRKIENTLMAIRIVNDR